MAWNRQPRPYGGPGVPTTNLIVRQAAFAFGFAEAVFDEEALRLNPRQFLPECVDVRIGKAIMGNLARAHFPANQQMPATGLGFLTVPNPNQRMQVFSQQAPFLAFAQLQSLPRIGRLGARPLIHP